MNRPPRLHPSMRRRTGRGSALLFALITVAALSLAAVALIRSVDTGVGVLGNLGFKQDSLLASDEATRQAVIWLGNNVTGTTLHANAASGYVALHLPLLDPTGNRTNITRTVIGWADKPCSSYTIGTSAGNVAACLTPTTLPALSSGVTAQYLIVRLCSAAGDPSAANMQCPRPLSSAALVTGEKGEINFASPGYVGTSVVTQYFRILVRTRGARGATSTTETLVHF